MTPLRFLTTLAALALLATPATADLRGEAEAIVAQSFREHEIFVNCAEQTPEIRDMSRDWMAEMIEGSLQQLTEIGYTPDEIAALRLAARYENLLLPDEATLQELRALCAEDPDFSRRFMFLDIVILDSALQRLIDAQ